MKEIFELIAIVADFVCDIAVIIYLYKHYDD